MKQFTVFVLVILLRGSLLAQQPSAAMSSAPNEVIVRFRSAAPGLTAVVPPEVIQGNDITVGRPVGGTGAFLLHSGSLSVSALLANIRSRPDVLYLEPNYVVRGSGTPNDFYYPAGCGPTCPRLWWMDNISAPAAWDDISTGSNSIVVGVVDTGIYYNHPDLTNNMWSAPSPNGFSVTVAGQLISCPAGTHGFTSYWNPNQQTWNWDCLPSDSDGHGTSVSGIVGEQGNNDTGVEGVNWNVGLMGIRILRNPSIPNCPGGFCGYISDAINAIEFAIQVKASGYANVRILSNSWGWNVDPGSGVPYGCGASDPVPCTQQALQDEISRANNYDLLFVAVAGNGKNGDQQPIDNDTNQSPTYPASFNLPNIISVAAVDRYDNPTSYSNYGPNSVHLAAPGGTSYDSIYSACPSGYCYYYGVSESTPHVSGAAALLLSPSACPTLTAAGVRGALLTSVDRSSQLQETTATGGRLNVHAAIQACQAPPLSVDLTLQDVNPFGAPASGKPVYWSPTSIAVSSGRPGSNITASGTGSITFQAGTQITLMPSLDIKSTGSGAITFTVGSQTH